MPDRHLKERTKEKKEAMVANFSFYNGYFGDNFWPKKILFDGRRPFGGNLSKNRARFAKFVEVGLLRAREGE